MPEFPRNRPHFYLHDVGHDEPYTSPRQGRTPPAPIRDRAAHALALQTALNQALGAAHSQVQIQAQEGRTGFYLQFELAPGNAEFAQNVEDRRRGVELVSVRRGGAENSPVWATVFVPERAADFFERKLQAYSATAAAARAKNENLINRVNDVAVGLIRSLFTDDENLLPAENVQTWWEVWLRTGLRQQFEAAANALDVLLREDTLIEFPEREVILAFSDLVTLGRLMTRTDAIAEIRLAKDTPAAFLAMNNLEQQEWMVNLINRLQGPPADAPSICILDSGVTQTHPLLSPGLSAQDLHTYDPAWGTGDSNNWRGHGTAMAGICIYGDLQRALLVNTPINLSHRLESVKMLHPNGNQHEPQLYGAVTAASVARAEIQAPQRPRVISMAVTSDFDIKNGRPSSWSAAIDKMCFGDETARRLFLISAGNVARNDIPANDYLTRNDIEQVLNPAQAWNALVIGGYTEKTAITDASFNGWTPIASAGDLSPTSRTSLTWERQWPIKPDVLFEGGNWATDGNTVDSPDDLALLTTHFQPEIQQFSVLGDTSAATAGAAHLAAGILARRPNAWPETVRALVVHSAEWTAAMKNRFAQANAQVHKLALLRRYGYGVPNFQRGVLSSINDATLIIQDSLQPFWRDHDGRVKTRHMHLHTLPWPRAALEELGEAEVSLRVTLSYFIEPNPGERGWTRRHRYSSHGLRFAMKRSLESNAAFRARINRAVELDEQGMDVDTGGDAWYLGSIRDLGSVHSDYWSGTAAELANRDAIAVFPVGGWWKEKPALMRYDKIARYALVVSIRATSGSVNIYTPIENAIAAVIPIEG
jgi:Subtilase family